MFRLKHRAVVRGEEKAQGKYTLCSREGAAGHLLLTTTLFLFQAASGTISKF